MYLNLAELYQDLGNTKAAQKNYFEVLRLDPSHKGANLGLAQIAYQNGDLPAALKFLSMELKIDPTSKGAKAQRDKMGINLKPQNRDPEN